MSCVSQVPFLSLTDKIKAVNSEMSEVQMEGGKCMVCMPSFFVMPSEKAGLDAHKADAVL